MGFACARWSSALETLGVLHRWGRHSFQSTKFVQAVHDVALVGPADSPLDLLALLPKTVYAATSLPNATGFSQSESLSCNASKICKNI